VFVSGSWLAVAGLVLGAVGFAMYFRVGTVRADPVAVLPPVTGRWVAVNSPASKVPSHGLHAYGQTYAVDLVHVPSGEWTLDFGWKGPHTRPPSDYVGFGQPVVAPAGGTVVRARGGRRDHGARTSYPGFLLMVAEGTWLEVTGRILGNHVVLEIAPRTYVAVAHLRRGSLRVKVGDTVRAGDVLGECGNSGNSSEPHVHVQVMDRPLIAFAAGLPMVFTDARTDDEEPLPMPANQQAMVVRADATEMRP
jgi:murein DD-endopeptidase MepM/ murein hydrolase activator NlpD